MTSLLVTNGTLVNEGRKFESDLLIIDGRIAEIGGDLAHRGADRVLDAAGKLVLPGMIDDQVHFREPGLMHKGDFASESRAAAAGGITSFMEMPNTDPLTIDNAALADKHARAKGRAVSNWSFYLGATNSNLEAIKAVDPELACGIKVFMGASTGDMLVDDPDALEAIFAAAPLLVATHCEDTPLIQAANARYMKETGGLIEPHHHPLIRSREACLKSSSYAVGLAKRHGTKLHVLHLTTADELVLFEAGPIEKKQITVEACVHHLFFDSQDYAALGSAIKCNPAIKDASDRQALLQAINDDVIDVIATDHAPHTIEEKARPFGQAPAGLPLVQHALLTLFEHWRDDVMSLERIVHKVCHAPAIRFSVKERGYLREGYHADIVIVDPGRDTNVAEQTLLAKCGWTPFSHVKFRAAIDTTIVNGQVVWDGEQIVATDAGRALKFARD